MLINLLLGTCVIAGTVVIHTSGMVILTRVAQAVNERLRLHRHDAGRTLSMIGTVLGLFGLHTLEVWLWAAVFLAIGAFSRVEDALYFSVSTFATVGYGDVVLLHDWRLLGAMEGINGFLLIGWSTAYLIAASIRHGPFQAGVHF
ncbi:potassium channel family protein [Zavarzinia sp. CC-PAN008]|uniref:potassium channel family protein n=1 Tax=Zavarzinia sp. CC-PAN008 TaxID=3243332 RepID=UPI003F744BA0